MILNIITAIVLIWTTYRYIDIDSNNRWYDNAAYLLIIMLIGLHFGSASGRTIKHFQSKQTVTHCEYVITDKNDTIYINDNIKKIVVK